MLKLYNTLSRCIEEFTPLNPPHVGMYSCGPTVYDYQHIGHMRRYVGDDILVRALTMNRYDVKHVMNITDVGHLVSDSDTGEDKMEKGAKKFGMSVWDIAKKFEDHFFSSMHLLNIAKPNVVMHATGFIEDQIVLIEQLEKKGFTYIIDDGVYFDTSKFPDYFKLSGQNPKELKAGARVDVVAGKKNLTDFALWKLTPAGQNRQMEWDSPWGKGFPGWHIECSAMSMRELGLTFDIHTGGIDHINIHHTNEIAQAEAATGQPFVQYWVHHAFLMVEGEKMSKSIGNIYTVQDVRKQGFSPLALRYLYLQTHYRQEMNFTWDALAGAQVALNGLYEKAYIFGQMADVNTTKKEPSQKVLRKIAMFEDAVDNDLDMPSALAILHEALKEFRDGYDLLFLLEKTDEILGFGLKEIGKKRWDEYMRLNVTKIGKTELENKVILLMAEREAFRKEKKYSRADQIRNQIIKLGYDVQDNEKTRETTVKRSFSGGGEGY